MKVFHSGISRLVVITLIVSLLTLFAADMPRGTVSASHGSFAKSQGVYRVPYDNGLTVTASNDHHNHPNAPDRIDMGSGKGSIIFAAASGIIRGIVDRHEDDYGRDAGLDFDLSTPVAQLGSLEDNCSGDGDADNVQGGKCSNYNNYVWIEHPNGEWTKYSHPETGTVTQDFGWSVGDTIMRGESLGKEGRVGAASGSHLHFEVAVFNDPTDTTPFSTNGGFLQNVSNLVAQVCFQDGDDDADEQYTTGESYTAGPCADTSPEADAKGPYSVDEGDTVQRLDETALDDASAASTTQFCPPACWGSLTYPITEYSVSFRHLQPLHLF